MDELNKKFQQLCPEEDQRLNAIQKWTIMRKKSKTESKFRFTEVLNFGYVTIENDKDRWKTLIKQAKIYYNGEGRFEP